MYKIRRNGQSYETDETYKTKLYDSWNMCKLITEVLNVTKWDKIVETANWKTCKVYMPMYKIRRNRQSYDTDETC